MKNIFHIANGDFLAEDLRKTSINGEIIVCREALVTGDLKADSLKEFWEVRAKSISEDYKVSKESYYQKSVSEFEKILNIPEGSDVNLWFEDDLFCQVNLWFCISLLSNRKDLKLYRVFPKANTENHWKGFSDSENSDLEESLKSRVLLNENDIELAINLWKAYQNNDLNSLKQLSENQFICFHFLNKVVDAYINIKPENFIKNQIENDLTDFDSVFKKFQEELGIFGFGDLQVKKIYEKVLNEK
ncbi:DUF1835 domain-containing protein [Epilithonimonas arachidiradicis]|uniref:Uncharacterized protein DUF1835 n=1 Tax=Epilithonimonas arachidiradicis TaxID=1617282 RepID=A0A420DDC8_9FLAO|nr:DUF1835 domain-containing protein [Epilithonimonas arachidiradicis]RKE89783.1 uncharacterized protein DUF1835 [Epilithonimonas arachidiradicis]GGG45293.1 hypothetical protein GCM10007332_03430 [Epilithonimonas arachidiradicis]